MKKVITICVTMIFAIMLLSCDKKPEPSKMYETTSRSKWSSITVEVHWISPNRISDFCKAKGTRDGGGDVATNVYAGCARSKPSDINVCEVYVVEPKDFDDTERLMHFGHEVWHCFGASHK